MAAISFVYILYDLLAPLMLEIDIDVRRLLALRREETLKQEIGQSRINAGDAEAVADGRVRRRAASLAENALPAGPGDDVVNRQEVGGIVQLGDGPEFLADLGGHLLRNALRIAPGRALQGETFKMRLRCGALRHGLVRVFIGELIEAEGAALRNLERAAESRLEAAEQARHFLRGFQVTLGIGLKPVAGRVDGAVLANAGHHVLQGAAFRRVVEHVIDGHEGRARLGRKLCQPAEVFPVAARVGVACAEPCTPRRCGGDAFERVPEGGGQGLRWQHDQHLPLTGREDVFHQDPAAAFLRPELAFGQEAGEAPVSRPVHRVGENVRPVLRREPGAHQQLQAGRLCRHVRAHDPRQRVAIRHADGAQAQGGGALHQFLRMAGPAKEGEVGRHRKFGISGHANSPCTNHSGSMPRSSP